MRQTASNQIVAHGEFRYAEVVAAAIRDNPAQAQQLHVMERGV